MVSGVEIDAFKEEREDRDQRRQSRIGEKRYQSTQSWKENSEWKSAPIVEINMRKVNVQHSVARVINARN